MPMQTLLLVVTGVSLVAALFLGWTAWRLSRTERERALARVAALAAAAAEPQAYDTPVRAAQADARAEPRTGWAQPAPAAVARSRPATRVATMQTAAAEEITWAPPTAAELPLHPASSATTTTGATTPAMGEAFLGGTTAYRSSGGQSLLAAVAIMLLMVLGAAGAWLYQSHPAAPAAAAALAGKPLELISLRHTRGGDRLAVSGMVRNPANGDTVDTLSASVLLFDQNNGYLTSARAVVDVPHLRPGEESPFTITVQAPAGAARYRVSFRSNDRLVNHVDRRGQVPAAAASALPAPPATR